MPLDSQEIQILLPIIRSFIEQCEVTVEVPPFDQSFYQECVDELTKAGYPMEGLPSVQTYLPHSSTFATIAYPHVSHETRKWIAMYGAGAFYADDVPIRWQSAMPGIRAFNKRFIDNQTQENKLLDLLADYLRQAPSHFLPIPANLILTSKMNFVNGSLMDYESKFMKHSVTSKLYPDYQRERNAAGEACAYYAFPPEIPLEDYLQAIPDMMIFMNHANDVLSFYKEELVDEHNNAISTAAVTSNKSKLEVVEETAMKGVAVYKDVVKLLEGKPEAFNAFRSFTVGYFSFHFAVDRYRLKDLPLYK